MIKKKSVKERLAKELQTVYHDGNYLMNFT